MTDVSIDGLSRIGLVKDTKDYKLAPEALTEAYNIRYSGDSIERLLGHAQVFGTPGAAPAFLLPVNDGSTTWWIYCSLTEAWVYSSGTDHDEITKTATSYGASSPADWNGVILGGIPIVNTGAEAPQYWADYSQTQLLQDLTNWPANTTAKVIRALGSFLVAINITKSGTNYPHMVKWSHPADPGTVPSSWDESDPTKLTGEKDLPDSYSGILVDALPLRSSLILYKEMSTWRMTFIGGDFVFKFDPILEYSGILAPRCVCTTGEGTHHFVVTNDDIILHNGSTPQTLLTTRMRKALFNRIDPTNYHQSFTFLNHEKNEIWFCYPEAGSSVPTRALLWNYERGLVPGAISEADCNFVAASSAAVEGLTATTWATTTETWDSATDVWNEVTRRAVLVADRANTKIYQLDKGTTRNGTGFAAKVERTGLSIIGRKLDGSPIVNFAKVKQVNRVWIRASGAAFRVRLGSQEYPEGPVVWTSYATFNPATDRWVDLITEGKAIAIEFSTEASSTGHWTLEGYTLDLIARGRF